MPICAKCHLNVIQVAKPSEITNMVNLSMKMAINHYSNTYHVPSDQILVYDKLPREDKKQYPCCDLIVPLPNGLEIYVEVKSSSRGSFSLTANEIIALQRLKTWEYEIFLVVISGKKGDQPHSHILRRPDLPALRDRVTYNLRRTTTATPTANKNYAEDSIYRADGGLA